MEFMPSEKVNHKKEKENMNYFSQMRKFNGNIQMFHIMRMNVFIYLFILQECSENETGSSQRAGETSEEKMFWSPLLLSARMW